MTTQAERIKQRKGAYERLFQGGQLQGDVKVVLEDLMRFAKINEPPLRIAKGTGASDPMATGVAMGRQEVVNRILAMIHLPLSRRFFNSEQDDE
jgi:hypothetical protein